MDVSIDATGGVLVPGSSPLSPMGSTEGGHLLKLDSLLPHKHATVRLRDIVEHRDLSSRPPPSFVTATSSVAGLPGKTRSLTSE